MPLRIEPIFDWINGKSPILIHTPWTGHYGNCAEEMYFGLLKARRDSKKTVFLFRHPLFWKLRITVSNRELFNIESDYSAVRFGGKWRYLGGLLLALVYGPLRALYMGQIVYARSLRIVNYLRPRWRLPYLALFSISIPSIGDRYLYRPDGIDNFSWDIVENLEWRQQFDAPLNVRLTHDKRRRAEDIRAAMGISQSDWFVCLHVREGGFRDDRQFRSHRNSSIQNYIKGIQAITDLGGWVVRMGDSSMTPLPAMERVIDYPHTPFKCELMDIYLTSACRFYIGTNSGPVEVARLFQKPMVLINLNDWSMTFPVQMGDLAIIKHIFSRSRNRFLSLKEILDGTAEDQSLPFLRREEYVMFDNSEEEICDVIEEYLDRPKRYEYSELQETFNHERRLQLRRWLDGKTVAPTDIHLNSDNDLDNTYTKYRIVSRTDSVAGAVGQKYLEQNWLVDNLEKSSFRPLIEN